ncbi:MAG TPA: PorV/PorQ family protein [Caldithrix abyssi]|uniref:PorV/PorQ family protein n=1 Tax=Caldithrix abyssi TaxID=187145 RepID=A0A7V5RNX2_CALAY|nr:PorV/PorQ family protein [Caldithrix abyssi]
MRKLLILLIIYTGSLSAGEYAGSFLELGVGAKALGMGSASVAIADDAYGWYWNPSGLAFIETFQAASMYANLFDQQESQSFVSAAMPIFGGVTVSASWMRLSVDDIPRYPGFNPDDDRVNGDQFDQLIGEPTGYFSSASDAFVFSFAKYKQVLVDLGWQYFELPIDFGFGGNIKVIRESIDTNSGNGIGVDLGMIIKLGLNDVFNDENYGKLVFGVNAQDLFETKLTWNTPSKRTDVISRNFKYGFAIIQPLDFLSSQFTFAFDLDSRYEGASHFGAEFLYDQLIALRAGLNESNFTAGMGLYVWKLRTDIAYQSHDLGNTYRISLLFQL